MSKAASPTRFSGEYDHFYDPSFTADISQKMRVPKRIRVDGVLDDEDANAGSNWKNDTEKFEMIVPDRILVAGEDRHIGTRAPPRELVLENSIMPATVESVRVVTPPRVIKLDEHFFPSAGEPLPSFVQELPASEETTAVVKPKVRYVDKVANRESTPPVGDGLTLSEEVQHLRRQMAKMNRRLMAMELDSLQRQQREKIIYAVGLAYLLVKTVLWLGRV
ncbi:transport and Golgi organization protein 11 [Bacillus rossius redtenbacheri]|uniref:transport and Golgi organization protein 11 n=1 Tax=Bacillus rossius redtenbacheri TaxID=93214 RepID=UPI002FDE4CB9